MFEAFVDGDALIYVDGEHAVDEVEGWVADAVPVRRRVVEAAHLYLLREVVGVFGRVEFVGEGREAAKADVEDDSKGPDVDGTGVFAVFAVFKYFRRNVYKKIRTLVHHAKNMGIRTAGCTTQSSSEGLFTNDLG